VDLGLDNKKKTMWAAGLGVFAVIVLAYMLIPSSPTAPPPAAPTAAMISTPHPAARIGSGKKQPAKENLDPTLRLDILAAAEQTKYEGTGRNIFVSQAEALPTPATNGTKEREKEQARYTPPVPAPPPPINLKFFGFASKPGEPKKIFLSQGDDVFIAAEGEIVDRRYRVIHIMPGSVEIQDVLGSGPPQNIPLTQS
jgi:hypothetical protein